MPCSEVMSEGHYNTYLYVCQVSFEYFTDMELSPTLQKTLVFHKKVTQGNQGLNIKHYVDVSKYPDSF